MIIHYSSKNNFAPILNFWQHLWPEIANKQIDLHISIADI